MKPGRTHLQDAVPITYGPGLRRLGAGDRGRPAGAAGSAADELRVIGLGGTAVGTGLTAHPRFRRAGGTRAVAPGRPAPEAGAEPARGAWSLRPLAGRLGRAARGGPRPGDDLCGPAPPRLRSRHRIRRAAAARGRAGLVDHAGQDQSLGAGGGTDGLLPGVGPRSCGGARRRRRRAGAERDDAARRRQPRPAPSRSSRAPYACCVPGPWRGWSSTGAARARSWPEA